ncbi:MAG: mechanosensitive ion channel family protein [Candidatus Woesearchaeota archaeon]
MIDIQNLIGKAIELSIMYIPKFVLAILTLIIGLWIIRLIRKGITRKLSKKDIEATLKSFITNLITALLKIILFIAVISMIGVETTSFIAVVAAMGFAIGLSLQGSLANFAGGVLIILFKPIAKGEFIEAQGVNGVVEGIDIFTTTLKSPDNKTIIIPNGPLANGNIINFSRQKTRRVDMEFGIGYDDNIKKAQKILLDIVSKHKKVHKDPAPFVRVGELGDSSVNFKVRAWCDTAEYWNVFFDITEEVKLQFDKEKITIPYPQRDIHLYNKR